MRFLRKEINDNKKLVKNIEKKMNKISNKNSHSLSSVEFKPWTEEFQIIKCYLEEFKKIRTYNKIIRSSSNPYRYIQPLMEIKSAFLRLDSCSWPTKIIESCNCFLHSDEIFLRDPTQLYPMIDLLDQICYYIDNNALKNDCDFTLRNLLRKKKLQANQDIISHYSNKREYSSYSLVSVVYKKIKSEIKNNLSVPQALQLIDYIMFLIGQEIQNQYLLHLFVDKNYIDADLESFMPTFVSYIASPASIASSQTTQQCHITIPDSHVSVIAVLDNKQNSLFKKTKKAAKPKHPSILFPRSDIRYFPELKICLHKEKDGRFGNMLTQQLSADSIVTINASQYNISVLFDRVGLSENNREWIFFNNYGKEIRRLKVADIRFALLYQLAKLKRKLEIDANLNFQSH